ncbi:tripartite tricarboxylate transporter substrate binding protein [Sporomusa sphaeroides DSM 2875]|uniref:Tripartite tricarboxylate transporter substrate binding protein n=1 Tax=uncultured Sporomusa sp. TaxID=307249 RepID=A0A212LLU5_9FIRM|nr:tripartite tricarboxylate transporter substrate binding protein [Sporomusa sphaeroides]MCM0758931.1 tripartite tricarboxylate transporter substrate binding protein [Sporomusa sphaeroides DSM 2875]SCM78379.1 conserved exported hypothetical protein [uncultured Sporomusa sp.]
MIGKMNKSKWKVVVGGLLAVSMLGLVTGCGKSADTKKEGEKAAFKPDKPITLVVPMAAGGSTDMLGRTIEKVWTKYSSQPIQILNKPGGGGVEGSKYVSRAKPDGYTLLMGTGSGHDIVMPHIQKVEYDPFKDLTFVSRLSIHTVVVLAPADSPFNSIKDVVEWAKKENKPVTAAVSTKAGAVDLVMRGLGKSTGINITPIPHAGGAQALTSLMGNQTTIGGAHPTEAMSQIKAGRVKPLGIATLERDPAMPNVPTLKEQGIDFYTWGSIKGIALPKDTPKEIVDYYADIFKKISEDPEYKKTMDDMMQPVMYLGPEEFAKNLKQASDDYAKLIKETGLDK